MKNKMLKILVPALLLAFLPACTASETALNGHPESVAEEDDVFYVACIGQSMTPTEKDGDGFIATLNRRGRVISQNAFHGIKLDAPKGAKIEDGVLYVADVDRIVGINLRLGAIVRVFDFSSTGTKYLNDIEEEDGFLYVSATDIGKIFRANLRTGGYEELRTNEPLNSPNGLAIDDGVLYVAEFAQDANGNPAGKIKAIPLAGTGEHIVSVIYNVPGLYDGLELDDEEDLFGNETEYLYFSDWAQGTVKKLNLRTREVRDATSIPMRGPADFIIEDDRLWVPVMIEKKIIID